MNKRRGTWICVILAAASVLVVIFLPGCRGEHTSSPPPASLVSITILPGNSSIAPGTTVQLRATGKLSNGITQNITASAIWNSSDAGVATISNAAGSQGLAAAATSIGTTTITAVFSGVTGTATLSTSHVSSIGVSPPAPPSIAPGTTQQFAATGILMNGAVQVLTPFATWTSLNPESGTVSDAAGSKGLATAGSDAGTATILAAFDGVAGSATLTSSHVQSIEVTPAIVSVPQGSTQQFAATGTLVDANTQDLTTLATWASSSTVISTISNTAGTNGLATALTPGFAGITATFDSITSSPAAITVTQAVLQSITIAPATQSTGLGMTQQYTAIASYSDGTTPDVTSLVTWDSSQPDVASISNSTGTKGLATSVKEGTTTITASLSGVTSNSATLTVTAPTLVSLLVTPISATISLATSVSTQQFTATGTLTDGSLQDMTALVTWASSDTTVATISNTPGTNGLAAITLLAPLPASTNITASLSGVTSNTVILTVTF